MKIAVLLTCHNRCVKTSSCLISLSSAIGVYNSKHEEPIYVEIFLTDDGCTDGTVVEARHVFPDEKVLHVLHGNGDLFWAGGMRFCWREAMKRNEEWNFYLLLNDDAVLLDNVFDELFDALNYSIHHYGKEGIVSGITCAMDDPNKLTYGGEVWENKLLATSKRVSPNGAPQSCDLTNANILLVPEIIVRRLGILYEGYRHGQADFDYSNMARKAGIPVILTAHFCGRCDRDHMNGEEILKKIVSMTLSERKAFFNDPVHSNRDYLLFIRRVSPIRFPLVWIGRMLNLYCPKLYYYISGTRWS